MVLGLHERLFLIAHGEAAGAAAKPRVLGPGLSAAIIIELVMAGRLAVNGLPDDVAEVGDSAAPGAAPDRRILLPGAQPPEHGSDVAGAVYREIAASEPHGPAYWLRALAAAVYERELTRLSTVGLIAVVRRRRLDVRRARVRVADPVALARAQSDVLHAVSGRRPADPETAALCGLAAVLRLEDSLEAYAMPDFGPALRRVSRERAPAAESLLRTLEIVLHGAPAALHREAVLRAVT